MSMYLTQARPYAHAVFAQAKAHQTLLEWSAILDLLTQVVSDKKIQHLIGSPKIMPQELQDMFFGIVQTALPAQTAKVGEQLVNFIALCVTEKRLLALADIDRFYHQLLAEQQSILEVEVVSAFQLEEAIQHRLQKALEGRMSSKVAIEYQTDKNLIGGIVIRSNKGVIDCSVKGQLGKMQASLID